MRLFNAEKSHKNNKNKTLPPNEKTPKKTESYNGDGYG